MYAHTHIHLYTYISQHVDPPNINALCREGGTRCDVGQTIYISHTTNEIQE